MADEKRSNARADLCILKIAAGDRDALRELYETYKNPVFRFALSIVKNFDAAEDVLQDTFLNILTYAASYKKGTNAPAWIFSIARNLCKKALTNQDNRFQNIEKFEASIKTSDLTADVLSSRETIEALSVLNEEELEIVSLYVYAELRQTEIAKALQLPYIKVRSKYGYAMRKLKSFYQERMNSL